MLIQVGTGNILKILQSLMIQQFAGQLKYPRQLVAELVVKLASTSFWRRLVCVLVGVSALCGMAVFVVFQLVPRAILLRLLTGPGRSAVQVLRGESKPRSTKCG